MSAVPAQYRASLFAFADEPERDELLARDKGIKTATCSTEDEPNTSTPGERWIGVEARGIGG